MSVDSSRAVQHQLDGGSSSYMFLLVFNVSRQEGWRLENETPTDLNSPLVFKGVVFNEMKGAFVSQTLCH